MAIWDDYPTTDKQSVQAGVLKDDTSANPSLPSSGIANNHYQLNTSRKKVIPAINEIKSLSDQAVATATGARIQFNDIVGDVADTEATAYAKVVANGGNVITAVATLIDQSKASQELVQEW
jgi:hypothetical protein